MTTPKTYLTSPGVYDWDLDEPRKRREGPLLLAIAGCLVAFLAGLFIDNLVDSTATDEGFVNVEGHEGEILVVRGPDDLRWTTEAELHEAAGHG